MRVELAYGRHALEIALPDALHVDVLEKSTAAPLADPAAELRAGLARPIGAQPLAELARGRRDAVIVVSDRTRPVPNARILPPILEALSTAGLPPASIFVQVATGLHRPLAPAELDEILGPALARELQIVQHDARSAASHTDLGRTRGGVPILIDRFFLERDLRVVTGLIEPHLMAGYSGGRKAVCPGLAAVDTIRVAHGPALLEGHVGPGILEGNPLHEALLEIVRRVGVDFLVNVALDRERRVAGVFCGDVEAAHAEGMRFVEAEASVSLERAADLVIVSGGGEPLDATFYQAIKGISAAAGIVRPGGVILLCAALGEGIGSASFEKLLRGCPSAEAFELQLADAEFFAIDQWMVQALCQAMRRARVLLYTDGIPLQTARELFVEPVDSPEAGVARALSLLPPHPRCAVLPQGPYVLATVRGERRPLAGSTPAASDLHAHLR
ncbi:MAG: nickel-dependent lactate racemase [Deltaproteobacteria bacterium]|nr:MAG: nickel-dependent lactate racemase [Deltaproteobacteria bacterium]